MKSRLFFVFLALCLAFGGFSPALAKEPIKLSPPDYKSGLTVLEALKNRKSDREYGSGELSRQQLSELLWAAGGVNRDLGGGQVGLTAPSSHGDQPMIIYAFTKDGIYKYDPSSHQLDFLLSGDYRTSAGVQSYVADAPLNLLYVADMSKVTGDTEAYKLRAVHMDAGHISQNVYLYAASAGLNTITRTSIDREELKELLNLSDNYEVLLGQTVGLAK